MRFTESTIIQCFNVLANIDTSTNQITLVLIMQPLRLRPIFSITVLFYDYKEKPNIIFSSSKPSLRDYVCSFTILLLCFRLLLLILKQEY